jgi:hypothetical protein
MKTNLVLLCLLVVHHGSALATVVEDFDQGVQNMMAGDFAAGLQSFRACGEHAGALHSIGNIMVMQGDMDGAAELHRRAKQVDSASIPPLANCCDEHETRCGGLGDLFWSTSVVKQHLFQNPEGLDWDSVHMDMATQLEAVGLIEYASNHLAAALKQKPADTGLLVHQALLIPAVYESEAELARHRSDLERRLSSLHGLGLSGGISLPTLDSFSMPGTFRIAYQGENDQSVMRRIAEMYVSLHPQLQYISPLALLKEESALQAPTKIRVGFLSTNFREHSVCKLLCGLIHELDRSRFEVVVLSPSSRDDSWTQYVKEVTLAHIGVLTVR